jgi:hypothetical protein
MSLDIHKLKNGRPEERLLSISDSEYSELLPVFDSFKSKTGLHIEQYSDLKLSSGVFQPLIEAIKASGNSAKIYGELLKVLEQSVVAGCGIMFVGD